MRFSINHKGQALTFVLSLLLIAGFWTGCGNEALTSSPGPVTYSGDNPPPFLTADGSAGISFVTDDSDWYQVAQKTIGVGGGEVEGSRYELKFRPYAVSQRVTISIFERDPDVLDMQFFPHGIQFNRAVLLEIDYAGTNADPSSSNYDGSVPAFFWYDDVNDQWVQLPGQNDVQDREYTVVLSHFSRYAVAAIPPGDGTADW